jgi:hypothetical protein
VRGLAVLLVASCAVVGCVGPSRTADDFASKATNAAELVRSSVETTLLGLQAADENRATLPYLSRLVGDVEGDALAAQSAFASVQPPDGASDELRAELLGHVNDAVDALADVRIALRREDVAAALSHEDDLRAVSDALAAFIERNG